MDHEAWRQAAGCRHQRDNRDEPGSLLSWRDDAGGRPEMARTCSAREAIMQVSLSLHQRLTIPILVVLLLNAAAFRCCAWPCGPGAAHPRMRVVGNIWPAAVWATKQLMGKTPAPVGMCAGPAGLGGGTVGGPIGMAGSGHRARVLITAPKRGGLFLLQYIYWGLMASSSPPPLPPTHNEQVGRYTGAGRQVGALVHRSVGAQRQLPLATASVSPTPPLVGRSAAAAAARRPFTTPCYRSVSFSLPLYIS